MTSQRQRLTDLQSGANFIPRHIGPHENEISSMLDTVGANSLEDLMHADRAARQRSGGDDTGPGDPE